MSLIEGPSALRPFRPREKEAAAAASFPLRGGVAWTIVQATLSLYLGLFQFIPRMSPHQGGRGRLLDRYTVTDMCVDLTCCLDTLEQDTTCPYGSVLSR